MDLSALAILTRKGMLVWLNRDGDEFLFENRSEEVGLRKVSYPNSPDEMEVEECHVRFSQLVFHYTCENYYDYCKYICISSMWTVSFLT